VCFHLAAQQLAIKKIKVSFGLLSCLDHWSPEYAIGVKAPPFSHKESNKLIEQR
jgi:hypothetical protein